MKVTKCLRKLNSQVPVIPDGLFHKNKTLCETRIIYEIVGLKMGKE